MSEAPVTVEQQEPYAEVHNKSVRSILQHQLDIPVAQLTKQFIENNIINPKQSKDVEDVIRAYWSLQDIVDTTYRINTMQQRIETLFKNNPALIKKLHICRNMFTEQQVRYTRNVRAILKFGAVPFFNTEYTDELVVPIFGEGAAWGQTSGLADKQVCIIIPSTDATWIKSITSPGDIQYFNFLLKMFSNFNSSDSLTMATSRSPMPIERTMQFKNGAYSSRLTSSKAGDGGKKGDGSGATEKYDVIWGNPFSETDTILKPGSAQPKDIFGNIRKRKKNESVINNDDDVHTGIISKYGYIEPYAFDADKYREVFDTYLVNHKLAEENISLYNSITARFEIAYKQFIQCCVDRAIIVTHQSMVDFLISAYERSFSIPQLMMYYSPGTMIKSETKYEVSQCSMILSSHVDALNGLSLMLNVLNPNTTKEQNVMVHDVSNQGLTKSKPIYAINLVSSGSRSGSIFNYYKPSSAVSIMEDEDIAQQLEYSRLCLQMATNTKHMSIDSNYYYSDRDWVNDPEVKQSPYKGRIVVDYIKSRSGFTDFSIDTIQSKHTFKDVYDIATPEYFKDKIVYPGGVTSDSNTLLLTGDMFLSDIRLLLSLPVAASAYILDDKRWGMVKLNDLQPVVYHPEAYDQLVMNDNIKETIKIVTENQNKNSFRDIIGGKESGCIFLLSGEPGTGKSLCAEAIAEKLQKPLYKVSTGELGSDEWKIESVLKRICEQAERWDAIILMDEADTFLRKRTGGDIDRNALVSIFLRQLEYFNGTLFLTSNRAEDIDPAFSSRILQNIKFVSLSADERATVWDNLLKRQNVSLDDKQLKVLAKYDINGRLIKNVIKVAIAMCLHKNIDLNYETLKETAETMHGGTVLTNKGFEKA